jgi:hypothetical protein
MLWWKSIAYFIIPCLSLTNLASYLLLTIKQQLYMALLPVVTLWHPLAELAKLPKHVPLILCSWQLSTIVDQ